LEKVTAGGETVIDDPVVKDGTIISQAFEMDLLWYPQMTQISQIEEIGAICVICGLRSNKESLCTHDEHYSTYPATIGRRPPKP
jgi:hypothetical protein